MLPGWPCVELVSTTTTVDTGGRPRRLGRPLPAAGRAGHPGRRRRRRAGGMAAGQERWSSGMVPGHLAWSARPQRRRALPGPAGAPVATVLKSSLARRHQLSSPDRGGEPLGVSGPIALYTHQIHRQMVAVFRQLLMIVFLKLSTNRQAGVSASVRRRRSISGPSPRSLDRS